MKWNRKRTIHNKRRLVLWNPVQVILFVFLPFVGYAVSDPDYQKGIASLGIGNRDKAREHLAVAYNRNPQEPQIAFAYARSAPCSAAVPIYQKLAEVETVPDSIRAMAYRFLGDYFYAVEAFGKAKSYYNRAAKYDKTTGCHHRWALAAMCSGDTALANSIWHTVSLEYGSNSAKVAHFYLGMLHLQKKEYKKAYDSFLKADDLSDDKWDVPILIGKLECASSLGMTDKISAYTRQLYQVDDVFLEEERFKNFTIASTTVVPSSTKREEKSIKNSSSRILEKYSLQVGAFGSKENASRMEMQLKDVADNVFILPVKVASKVLYRVRVGKFTSREEAENYAVSRLEKAGIAYRVVEDD
jgi:tetratricopeptide (TPR) repeat protein